MGNKGIDPEEFTKYQNRIGLIYNERALYHHPEKWVATFTENLLWGEDIEQESKHRSDDKFIEPAEINKTAREIFLESKQIIISYGGPKNFIEDIQESLISSFGQHQIKSEIK